MTVRLMAPILVALLAGLVPAPALAQDAKKPQGITTRNLVTSLGGFSATVSAPVFLNGATVELAPNGQTGRQQFRVPTYIYVIEGILTTEYEAGPVGIMGARYHAAGQSFMDNGGWWHNHVNRGAKPVKFSLVSQGAPPANEAA